MKRNQLKFTLEERMRIVQEYETSGLTLPELCHKYGIKSPSCITNWRAKFRKSSKSINFAPGITPRDAAEPTMRE